MGNFDIADFVSKLVIHMVVWLFAVSVHEAAHAWMSLKFGDDTAQRLGRVTLNPISHIDLFGTLILPIVAFTAAYSPNVPAMPLLMWGKPTPVNPLRWRNKNVANAMVSLAGIGANLITAILATVLVRTLLAYDVLSPQNAVSGIAAPVLTLLVSMVILNVGLAVFNLIPLPPLDGGKAIQSVASREMEPIFDFLETYGIFILFVLIWVGAIGYFVRPLNNFILGLLFWNV